MPQHAWIACALLPLLGGCLVVPTFEYADTEPDLRCIVGDAQSPKPVRPGVSRAQVVHLLNEPQAESNDHRAILYRRVMSWGYGIILPPLYPGAGPLQQRIYYLRLDFDERDTLQGYELTRDADYRQADWGYAALDPTSAYARWAGDEVVCRAP